MSVGSSAEWRSTPGPYLLELELLRDRIPDATRFPYNLPAVRGLTTLPFHPKVTFLVGENGAGKSTVLEAIAVACGLNPEGGSRNFNFATRASHSPLDECVRLARTPALAGDSYFLRFRCTAPPDTRAGVGYRHPTLKTGGPTCGGRSEGLEKLLKEIES